MTNLNYEPDRAGQCSPTRGPWRIAMAGNELCFQRLLIFAVVKAYCVSSGGTQK